MGRHGGRRPGAGRPKGSKNKSTIAKEVVGEIIDAPNPAKLEQAIQRRGHAVLAEVERIALDPTHPPAVRIMAAKTALPYLLTKTEKAESGSTLSEDVVAQLNEGRRRAAEMAERARRGEPEFFDTDLRQLPAPSAPNSAGA